MDQKFNELSEAAKADFFVKCQELLIQHHPDSPFIITKENWGTRRPNMLVLLDYKGFCYRNNDVCVLYNLIRVEDPKDIPRIVRETFFQPPHPDYNAIAIDFVVFKELKDCLEFCKTRYEPRIANVVYVKNNEPKVYPTDKLLAHLAKA